MKNFIIWFIVLIIFIITMFILSDEKLKITVFASGETYYFNYRETVYLKDILMDDSITVDNSLLDTSTLGQKEININFEKNNNIYNYNIIYNVVDKTPPVIMGSASRTIKKGTNVDLVNSMLCGDNYDKRPNCYIEGSYNVNKVGTYNLKYVAEDSSGNKTERDYKLTVKNSLSGGSSSSSKKVLLNDIIKEHKTDNTMIGIDVSSWQGNINWTKVKNAGVEFAMIRIGYGHNDKNELVFDSKFKNNLKNAKEAGIKVGLYFYTYATNKEDAIEQANWIVDALNGEKLDLGIAFDWESWSRFNGYNISFTDLNDIAETFIKEVKKHGYEGMIYGSCSYLERIWNLPNYKTWLAHYATKTDYTKEYYMWQLTSSGRVDGIDGNVDLDILYK